MRQSQDKAPARPAPATAGSRTREPWQPALHVSAPADAPRDPLCGRDGERGGSETPPGSPCALTPTRSSWFRSGVAPGRAVQPAAKTLFFIANKGQAQPRKSRRALQHAGSSSWHEPAQPEGHQHEGSPRLYKAGPCAHPGGAVWGAGRCQDRPSLSARRGGGGAGREAARWSSGRQGESQGTGQAACGAGWQPEEGRESCPPGGWRAGTAACRGSPKPAPRPPPAQPRPRLCCELPALREAGTSDGTSTMQPQPGRVLAPLLLLA